MANIFNRKAAILITKNNKGEIKMDLEKIMIEIINGAEGKIIDEMFENTFSGIKSLLNEKIRVFYSQKIAQEGIRDEEIEEYLKNLTDKFSKEINNTKSFTDEELREKFDSLYDKYLKDIDEESNREYGNGSCKEELWRRFKIYSDSYLKKYNESISYGENRIIDLIRNTKITIERLKKESAQNFGRLAEGQREILNYICENKDIPFIEVNKMCGIKINDYDSKYNFYGNVFDFESGQIVYDDDDEGIHILSLLIKNIGQANIEEISIGNISMQFCKECYDDDPREYYYVLPVVKYDRECRIKINILPGEEQFVYCILKNKMDELSDEEEIDGFFSDGCGFYYDRIQIEFDMLLKNKKIERKYNYSFYLSDQQEESKETINGLYTIDFSRFDVIL